MRSMPCNAAWACACCTNKPGIAMTGAKMRPLKMELAINAPMVICPCMTSMAPMATSKA